MAADLRKDPSGRTIRTNPLFPYACAPRSARMEWFREIVLIVLPGSGGVIQ